MSITLGLWGFLCLAYAALIILILRQRQKNQPGFVFILGFAIVLFISSAAQLFQSLYILSSIRQSTRASIPLYFDAVTAAVLFEATAGFVQLGLDRWAGRGVALIWLATAILYNENIHGLFLDVFQVGGLIIYRASAGAVLVLVPWAAYSLLSLLVTIRDYRRTVHPLHHNRDIFWLVGIVVYLIGAILTLTVASSVPVGELVVGLSAGLLSAVFFTHNLPDLRRSIRTSFSTLVSLFFSILIYGLFFFFTLAYLRSYQKSADSIVIAVGLAAMITLLLHPITRLIQRFVSRIILEGGSDPANLISDYSKKISNIIDLDELAGIVSRIIMDGLRLHRVRLFLVDQSEDAYRMVAIGAQDGKADSVVITLAPDSPVAAYLKKEHNPLAQYDIDLLPRYRNAPSEIAQLKKLEIDLYISIYNRERWIGLLGLGAKKSGDRYYEKELALLETLADQTAVALENARLYQDLKIRNADNERLNMELVKANQDLSRLDKAKSDFINIASHELRTPLTQIIGYNDMLGDVLKSGFASPTASIQMLEGIRKGTQRLEEMVNAMFDVSKLDLSTLELNKSPVLLATIIEAAVDRWQEALAARKLSLTVRDIEGLPTVEVDGKRMVQVFSHLIQNAIKFTPDGGEITISSQAIEIGGEKNERFVEIQVSDTGIGIAPEELERIFDKFYRVGNVLLHSTGDYKFKGAEPGLGLTICRGIVEAHGGRVWAESPGFNEETHPGSKFHMVIPCDLPEKISPKM